MITGKKKLISLLLVGVVLAVLAIHYKAIRSGALVWGSRSYHIVKTVLK